MDPSCCDAVLVRRALVAATAAKDSEAESSNAGIGARAVSSRLQPWTYGKPYVVKKIVGSKSYVLADPTLGAVS